MQDPEIDRTEVEKWIDNVLVLEDNVDQHRPYSKDHLDAGDEPTIPDDLEEKLEELDLSEEVRAEVFDEEWLESQAADDGVVSFPAEPEKDLLAFFQAHGKQYDEDAGKAVEMTEWQRDVLDMLREEAYYFAPQKMTKVGNEGWAAYWESMMMGEEAFAGPDEFLSYADHQARVLGSPGLNPYKLGKELWEFIENTTNRREVVDRLLRVEGITWRNLNDAVDFGTVLDRLEPPDPIDRVPVDDLDRLETVDDNYVDHEALERAHEGDVDLERYPWKVLTYEGLARRHYSLVKPQNRGVLSRIGRSELERIGRYVFDTDRYATIDDALDDVEFTAGWDRMREIRESHNDVTFIDEFLTQEFVDENDYFTYEFSHATGQNRVASTDYEDVKKKLLLQFTNFGKPTIAVYDGNYDNRNELLLGHEYNGVALDVPQAKRVLERIFELWGRPVNLMTIVKELDDHDVEVARRRNREPEPTETGRLIRYDGVSFDEETLPWETVEHLAADDVDYDTKPEDWLA
jgi:stage V sporulation protein R